MKKSANAKWMKIVSLISRPVEKISPRMVPGYAKVCTPV